MPPSEHVVYYENQRRTTPDAQATGRQLREMFGLDAPFELIVEGVGTAPDRVLSDYDVISLRDGPVRVFLRPPTAFGGGTT